MTPNIIKTDKKRKYEKQITVNKVFSKNKFSSLLRSFLYLLNAWNIEKLKNTKTKEKRKFMTSIMTI
jgi:hypothetical protein